MTKVYVVGEDKSCMELTQLRCKDEGDELQTLLERNPHLLPGEQIDPEDPRRWLLIKREMPVPDPESGTDRWSIDFLYADQSAVPTFVECKRFLDTRSRREVVAQMLDYAANGHSYWHAESLRKMADTAGDGDLATRLANLQPDEHLKDPADYFQEVEKKLREGELRLVFFLEEAPHQLKSIVEFLNRQMENTEVLVVEARLFCSARALSPWWFRLCSGTPSRHAVQKRAERQPARTVRSGGNGTRNRSSSRASRTSPNRTPSLPSTDCSPGQRARAMRSRSALGCRTVR
jgi:hypothetical protein